MAELKEYFVISNRIDNDGFRVTAYTKSELERHIAEENSESIRHECLPHYLEATQENLNKLYDCGEKGDDYHGVIIVKGVGIVPKPVRVVKEFKVD